MAQRDTSLDDIAQSIQDLGTMVSEEFRTVKKELKTVKNEQTRQAGLLEDAIFKFDKNIDLLSKEMRVKKRVDKHEKRLDELESGQKTIKKVVQLHSEQLAGR